jgi:hypothetical protein
LGLVLNSADPTGQATLAHVDAMTFELLFRNERPCRFVQPEFSDSTGAIESYPREIAKERLAGLQRFEICVALALEDARAAEQVEDFRFFSR